MQSRCEEIYPGIFRIVLPVPGKKPGPINVYLFKGKHTTLVDTGMLTTAHILEESLRGIGVGFSDISRIIFTHGHIEHYGAAKRIIERGAASAAVAAHPEDLPLIEHGLEVPKRQIARYYRLMGVPLPFQLSLYLVGLIFSKLAEDCPVDEYLADGDEVFLGDYRARVKGTPGHTRGSICLHLEQEGLLFAGDHILSHITPNAFVMLDPECALPRRMSQVEFYDSLRKIESLAPRIVYPAHGDPITDLPAIAAMFREQFSLRQARIREILKKGELTPYRIARRLFPEISGKRLPLEIYLAVSEVFTHLQVLEKDGVAISRQRRGAIRYALK